MPSSEILDKYYNKLLYPFPKSLQNIERKYDTSFAEAKDYSYTTVKTLLIEELEKNIKNEGANFK